jgi:hypothetical protein
MDVFLTFFIVLAFWFAVLVRRRTGDRLDAAMDALPGAGSAPGTTMPSYGVVVRGDRLAALRAHTPPVVARVRDALVPPTDVSDPRPWRFA